MLSGRGEDRCLSASFTKHAEPIATDLQKPLPVARGFIHRQRDRSVVVLRTIHRWFAASNEFLTPNVDVRMQSS